MAIGEDLQLGKHVAIPAHPADALIDTVPAPCPNGAEEYGRRYLVRFSCPEFTALCPVTEQPDFAHIVIDYAPHRHLIESKALKLFLASFRNHRMFHEACANLIGTRLVSATAPLWLRVCAFFYPRGGIPIDVFWEMGELPLNLRVPPIDIPTYRAR